MLFFFGLAFVACVSGLGIESPLGYHEKVGIPEAARIKAFEDGVNRSRIVGGSFAPDNEYPYLGGLLISLVDTFSTSVCGSSLVSPNRLVTAAHCWFDGRWQGWSMTVVLGSNMLFSGGTRVATSQVVMHSLWNPVASISHDIAMIYLPNNVELSGSISPVALPESFELFLTFEGQVATAAGFGRTNDAQVGIPSNAAVSHVRARVVDTAFCQAFYGFQVTDWNICTDGQGGVGICGGDSGGPLVLDVFGRRILVGVSGFTSSAGCQLGFPSGFTRVTSYINFIQQHL